LEQRQRERLKEIYLFFFNPNDEIEGIFQYGLDRVKFGNAISRSVSLQASFSKPGLEMSAFKSPGFRVVPCAVVGLTLHNFYFRQHQR